MCRLELIRKLNILVQLKRDTYLKRLRNHQDTIICTGNIIYCMRNIFSVTVSHKIYGGTLI